MKMHHKNIFFLFIFQIHVLCASELFVFNVGQGSCNLFAPKTPNCVPLLYDAGSTKFPEDLSEIKRSKLVVVKEISDAIKTVSSYQKIMTIVISHGDTDHYSYILDIIKDLGAFYKFHFFLGGKRSHYSKSFIDGLENIPPARCLSYYYAENLVSLNTMPNIGIDYGYTAKFLSLLVSDDKNASSLVLKISKNTSPDEPFVLLTGDATDTTTSKIPKTSVNKTTILIANHHGSGTLGSNNQEWVDKTEPEITVFSAKESSHEHPNHAVVSRYFGSPRLRAEALHELSYSGNRIEKCNSLVTYSEYSRNNHQHYRALTRKAMYSTMNEGTMRFQLGDKILIRPDKPFFSTFPMKGLMTLDLSSMEMVNLELVAIFPKLHIMYSLEQFNLHDNLLDLSEDSEEGKESVECVNNFLKAVISLKELSLWKNTVAVDYIKSVVTALPLFSKLKFEPKS